MLDKRSVLDALIRHLAQLQAQLASAAEEVRRDATHEEAKPENDKDTRALEQTYLARGQAMRAEALTENLQLLRTLELPQLDADARVQSGALVELEDDSGTRVVFMAPSGGGVQLDVAGANVLVITPAAALGRALLGRRRGDDVELRLPTGTREYTIVSVR